jgi:hypothetical protein
LLGLEQGSNLLASVLEKDASGHALVMDPARVAKRCLGLIGKRFGECSSS